jgi:hypothetical protein
VTREERFERGLAAARLLTDDTFLSVFRFLAMQAFQDFEDVGSDENAVKLKHRADAIRAVKSTLKSWAVDAELIAKENAKT